MPTHKMDVVIPEDHRLVVRVPETLEPGPAELILVVPGEAPSPAGQSSDRKRAEARWSRVVGELLESGKPFHQLSREQRRERHRLLRGIGRGLLPSSEEVAEAKRSEVDLEDRKLDP